MEKIPIRQITATQKDPNFFTGFSIRDIGELLAGEDLVQKLHRHDFFYILALKKGMGNHEIDFTSYDVCDNVVFFMRPGQVHQLELKAGCTGFLVEFDAAFYHPKDNKANKRLIKASNKNFCELASARFNKILSLLAYIFIEFTEKQEGHTEVIKANLEIFFVEFIRQSGNPLGTSKEISTYSQERLQEFLGLLETHISDYKQVSQYADMLNLSTYQLNAITKTTLGKTCSDLINEYIILESKRWLLATSNQVNQIADHLGYEDVSYFIRFFKKHAGFSPEAFRHNFR
ncbi:MAG: AraC family transcriptional regulator [Ferruginibacter sp.]